MLLEDIRELRTRAYAKRTSQKEDFENLWEMSITDKYPAEERLRYVNDFSLIFWLLCSQFENDTEDVEITKQIAAFIDYINSISSEQAEAFYPNKEAVFVQFLHSLMHRSDSMAPQSASEFMVFYSQIYDIIDEIKWLFSLLKEDNKKLFPIRSLLEDVANTFQLDQEHYLQLVFSLEIFNNADLEELDKTVVREKMQELADRYHIRLIELLCEGGKVLFEGNASANSSVNGTIIVRSGDIVLIRNTSREYFGHVDDQYSGHLESEGVDGENPIAFYYEYRLKREEKQCGFGDIFTEGSLKCRQEVLDYIFDKKHFNVFLGKSFLISRNDNSFSRMLNPFGFNDCEIVFNAKSVGANDKVDNFIYVVQNYFDEYGLACVARRGEIDVLTLDFILSFYGELVQSGNAYMKRMLDLLKTEEDYYQNLLFKVYFDDALVDGTIFQAIEKYSIFIDKYVCFENVNADTDFSTMNKLIMPYKPFVFCDGDSFKLYDSLREAEYVSSVEVVNLTIEKSGRTRKKYLINDNEVEIKEFCDIQGLSVEEDKIHDGYCLFDSSTNIIYQIKDYKTLMSRLNLVNKRCEMAVLDKTWERRHDRFEEIHNISNNIGFSNLKVIFDRTLPLNGKKETLANICLYKLLWHIQVFELKDERYSLFKKLILEHYYTEFVLNPNEYSKSYFDDLMKDGNEGKMIVAKESDGERSTLKLLFEQYSDGSRGALEKAFDGAQIADNHKCIGKKHYYLGQEIESIVFITDNIMSGSSTKAMLDFYIKNIRGQRDKRTYLWKHSYTIPSIIANSNVNVVLKCIFATKKGIDYIEKSFVNENLKVLSQHVLPDDKYRWTEEVETIIDELYEPEDERHQDEVYGCFFRPYNMPSDKVLPEFVMNPYKLVGIFQRKEEV